MRFYEYESKALFARHGMPLCKSGLAKSADDARRIATEIGCPGIKVAGVAGLSET